MTLALDDLQRAAIARDPRPYKVVAAEYGVTDRHVTRIKRKAGTQGTREHPNRGGEPVRKVLPERHYRVDWDRHGGARG